jgi:hypothetical protein
VKNIIKQDEGTTNHNTKRQIKHKEKEIYTSFTVKLGENIKKG